MYITVATAVVSHCIKLPMPHLYNPGFTHVLKHTHLFSTAEQQCIMHNNNVSCTSSHVSSLRRVWLTRRLTYGLAGVVRVDFHDNEYAQCIQTPDNSCTHFNSCACVLTFSHRRFQSGSWYSIRTTQRRLMSTTKLNGPVEKGDKRF